MRESQTKGARWLGAHRAEVRAATRAVVAALLAYAVATLAQLPQPYWSVIVSLLVVQATVGASLQTSLDWLIGTIGGAVYGSLVAALVPHDDPYLVILALFIALAPLAFLAAVNGRYRIAPMTAVIALIVPRGPEVGAIAFTLERTAEVGIGALVAAGVSLVVLPSRAHSLIAEAVANVLEALADLIPRLAADTAVARPNEAALVDEFAALRAKMSTLDAAAAESRRERRIRLSEDPDPAALVMAVVRVRNDAIMVFRATSAPFPEPVEARLSPRITAVAAAASAHLRSLARAFGTRAAPPPPSDVQTAVAAYAAEVDAIRAEGLMRDLPTETVERLFSLGFAVDQLGDNLVTLVDCCGPYARPPVRRPTAAPAA
ncbi:MAG: FUSC family protein [Bauldia sp.]|nr:FUSC family protein [Bauldia sp.]